MAKKKEDSSVCEKCLGTGLIDAHTICDVCEGSGVVE